MAPASVCALAASGTLTDADALGVADADGESDALGLDDGLDDAVGVVLDDASGSPPLQPAIANAPTQASATAYLRCAVIKIPLGRRRDSSQ
ncbi:hypothetical protein [Knoellia remsis]|uniref:hypothetical protein n=1 Tax=Knoellia remsis TaxID=407159 RepID=UPI0011B23507|nr:hypothetical protein [Knoellia remsis]